MVSTYIEESPLATEVRRVFSKLVAKKKTDDLKTVMITSSVLGEGKTTIASYLAIACSQYRSTRTALIDMDLRRPRVHDMFGLKRSKRGVSDVLGRGVSPTKCLRKTKFRNLYVLTTGQTVESPSRLLNSGRLKTMFRELRPYFDIILVDAPPVIPVSDPMMLSSEVDGALFVVKAGKTQKPVIHRAIGLLQDAQIEPLGVVINNMHHVLPYYYDYQFYDYQYYDERTESGTATSAEF